VSVYSVVGFLGAFAICAGHGRWITGRGTVPSGWGGVIKVLLRRVLLDGMLVLLLTVSGFVLDGWLFNHDHSDAPVWQAYGGALVYIGLEWLVTVGRFALVGLRTLFSNRPLGESKNPYERRYLRTESVWAEDNWVASEIDLFTMTATVTQSLAGAEIRNVLTLRRDPAGKWESKTVSATIGGEAVEIDSDDTWEPARTATFVNGEALGDAEIETAYQRYIRS